MYGETTQTHQLIPRIEFVSVFFLCFGGEIKTVEEGHNRKDHRPEHRSGRDREFGMGCTPV